MKVIRVNFLAELRPGGILRCSPAKLVSNVPSDFVYHHHRFFLRISGSFCSPWQSSESGLKFLIPLGNNPFEK